MQTFADNTGRKWTVCVNVDAIKRVRSLLGINLLDVLDDGCKLLAQLHDERIGLSRVFPRVQALTGSGCGFLRHGRTREPAPPAPYQ
jgi:hypothetical protein